MIRPVVTFASVAQAYAPWHIDLTIRTVICVMTSDEIDLRPVAHADAAWLDALRPGPGVGRVLFDAVTGAARARGCRRLWLVTTNDNTRALRFYQRRGLDLVALHRDAATAARAVKPTLPEYGEDGIAVRHELELELRL